MKRQTKQRDVIMACFNEAEGPVTPAMLHRRAVRVMPTLGIATVYRAINAFSRAHLVKAILIGGTTWYELSEKGHHHHFFCQQCERAFCIDDCPVANARLAPNGFKVVAHELIVSGLCSSCHASRSQKN